MNMYFMLFHAHVIMDRCTMLLTAYWALDALGVLTCGVLGEHVGHVGRVRIVGRVGRVRHVGRVSCVRHIEYIECIGVGYIEYVRLTDHSDQHNHLDNVPLGRVCDYSS